MFCLLDEFDNGPIYIGSIFHWISYWTNFPMDEFYWMKIPGTISDREACLHQISVQNTRVPAKVTAIWLSSIAILRMVRSICSCGTAFFSTARTRTSFPRTPTYYKTQYGNFKKYKFE